jgi:AcrR family transcriptional regulator
MSFKRARTEGQMASRQLEILVACESLYRSMDFENITLAAIAEMTSLTRPAIYNYYKTKEEVFLDLLRREYLGWHAHLTDAFEQQQAVSREDFCKILASSLTSRIVMLKLLSIHLTSLENHCSLEKLAEFKRDCSVVFQVFQIAIQKYFPNTPQPARETFQATFFPFLFGLYPYTHLSEKQQTAAAIAQLEVNHLDFGTVCLQGIEVIASCLRE